MAQSIFGDMEQLSDLDSEALKQKLLDIGEEDAARQLAADASDFGSGGDLDDFSIGGGLSNWLLYPFLSVSNVIGHFNGPGPLTGAANAKDPFKAGAKVSLLLDRLYVHRYPGWGKHEILFEATMAGASDEAAHIAKSLSVSKGIASVAGWPLFQQLVVPSNGLHFAFQSINLSSSFDKSVLKVLSAKEFKQGLAVLESAGPAIGQVSKMMRSLVEWSANQSSNSIVQQFDLGFDQRPIGSPGARLAPGTFVVVQLPTTEADLFRFEDWIWEPNSATIRHATTEKQLEANYFCVSLAEL